MRFSYCLYPSPVIHFIVSLDILEYNTKYVCDLIIVCIGIFILRKNLYLFSSGSMILEHATYRKSWNLPEVVVPTGSHGTYRKS